MTKSTLVQQPKFLDALIPGRYFNRLGIHTDETLRKHGKGDLPWNTVSVAVAAWLPFWLTLTAFFQVVNEFLGVAAGLLSPYALFVAFASAGFIVFYPGTYYLFNKQRLSLKYVSHHIFTVSPSGTDVLVCKSWLAWWRAALLPGVDVGNLWSAPFGRLVGILQLCTFMLPFCVVHGPFLANFLSDGRYDLAFIKPLETLRDSVNPLFFWGLSLFLYCLNYFYGHRWVQHVADMSPEERAALPL